MRAARLQRLRRLDPSSSQRALEPTPSLLDGSESQRARRIPDRNRSGVVPDQQVLGGDLASARIVDCDAGQRRMADVDERGGEILALQACDRVGPLRERLDVEQEQVTIAVLTHPLDDPAKPLQHRAARGERRGDADRVRATQRQVACGRTTPVAELVGGKEHALTRVGADQRTVIEHRGTVPTPNRAHRTTSLMVGGRPRDFVPARSSRQQSNRRTGLTTSRRDEIVEPVPGSRERHRSMVNYGRDPVFFGPAV